MAVERKTAGANRASVIMGEALQKIARSTDDAKLKDEIINKGTMKEETVKTLIVSVEQILAVDNEIRESRGVDKLSANPVMEKQWVPSEKKMYFQRLKGAKIIRKDGELPKIIALFEDCEGYDPAEKPEETNAKVEAHLKKNYPNGGMTPEIRKAAIESVTQTEQMARSGTIKQAPEKEEEVEAPESPRRGRPRGS